ERFAFRCPNDLVDPRSGVICVPNNYAYSDDRQLEEGVVRFTAQASYDGWSQLDRETYAERKAYWFDELGKTASKFLPVQSFEEIKKRSIATDMFTPATVEKFTGRLRGAVYGSPQKTKTGKTHLNNLFICGTDQGFLGIVGAMLSGITMANLYGLRD
ncbi:MAG: phytoene dehydrogenase, partial [Verrucomicrobiae bacterium]|nr:phytoene dehydrogenase [Verrucomicrobiae bacterium]